MFKSTTTELDCASFLPAHRFFTNEKPPDDEKSKRRRRIPTRVQFLDQSFITSVKRKVVLRFTDSVQKTTAQAKLVSQAMSIYIAVHERDFDKDEGCLWKEGKKIGGQLSQLFPKLVKTTRTLVETPNCTASQQDLITESGIFIKNCTKLLDNFAILNEHEESKRKRQDLIDKLHIDRLQSKKKRALREVEKEKERKASLEKHHTNAEFFYNIDKSVAEPAATLAAVLTDLVQDWNLSKRLCHPTKLDILWKTIKMINERFIYFEQVGKFEVSAPEKRDRNEDMTQLANFHFALSYLLVVVNSWVGSIHSGDEAACESPSVDMKLILEKMENTIIYIYNMTLNTSLVGKCHELIRCFLKVCHLYEEKKWNEIPSQHPVISKLCDSIVLTLPHFASFDSALKEMVVASKETGSNTVDKQKLLASLLKSHELLSDIFGASSTDVIEYAASALSFAESMTKVSSLIPEKASKQWKAMAIEGSEIILCLRKLSESTLCVNYQDRLLRQVKNFNDAQEELLKEIFDEEQALRTSTIHRIVRLKGVSKYNCDVVSSQTYYEAASEIKKICDDLYNLTKETFSEENANKLVMKAFDLIESEHTLMWLIVTADSKNTFGKKCEIDYRPFKLKINSIRLALRNIVKTQVSAHTLITEVFRLQKLSNELCSTCTRLSSWSNKHMREYLLSAGEDISSLANDMAKDLKEWNGDPEKRTPLHRRAGAMMRLISSIEDLTTGPEFAYEYSRFTDATNLAIQDFRQSVILILDKLIFTIDAPSSAAQESLSSALQSCQETILFHAPGQAQCNKALANFASITQKLQQAFVNVDGGQPILDKYPRGSLREHLQDASALLQDLESQHNSLAASSTSNPNKLGSDVLLLNSTVEKIFEKVMYACCKTRKRVRQQKFLTAISNYIDPLTEFVSCCREAGGNPQAKQTHHGPFAKLLAVRCAKEKLCEVLEDNPEQQLFGLTYMLDRGFKKLDLLKSGSPDVSSRRNENQTFLQLVNKIFSVLSIVCHSMSQIRTCEEKNLKSMAKVIIKDWLEFIDLLGYVQELNTPIIAKALPYVDDFSSRLSEALRSSSDISNSDFGADARLAMNVSLEETAIVIHQILQVFAIENFHEMPGTLACIQTGHTLVGIRGNLSELENLCVTYFNKPFGEKAKNKTVLAQLALQLIQDTRGVITIVQKQPGSFDMTTSNLLSGS